MSAASSGYDIEYMAEIEFMMKNKKLNFPQPLHVKSSLCYKECKYAMFIIFSIKFFCSLDLKCSQKVYVLKPWSPA
jgi:methylase of polypeptide subunit release factors